MELLKIHVPESLLKIFCAITFVRLLPKHLLVIQLPIIIFIADYLCISLCLTDYTPFIFAFSSLGSELLFPTSVYHSELQSRHIL
jgi:hypothetical protein